MRRLARLWQLATVLLLGLLGLAAWEQYRLQVEPPHFVARPTGRPTSEAGADVERVALPSVDPSSLSDDAPFPIALEPEAPPPSAWDDAPNREAIVFEGAGPPDEEGEPFPSQQDVTRRLEALNLGPEAPPPAIPEDLLFPDGEPTLDLRQLELDLEPLDPVTPPVVPEFELVEAPDFAPRRAAIGAIEALLGLLLLLLGRRTKRPATTVAGALLFVVGGLVALRSVTESASLWELPLNTLPTLAMTLLIVSRPRGPALAAVIWALYTLSCAVAALEWMPALVSGAIAVVALLAIAGAAWATSREASLEASPTPSDGPFRTRPERVAARPQIRERAVAYLALGATAVAGSVAPGSLPEALTVRDPEFALAGLLGYAVWLAHETKAAWPEVRDWRSATHAAFFLAAIPVAASLTRVTAPGLATVPWLLGMGAAGLMSAHLNLVLRALHASAARRSPEPLPRRPTTSETVRVIVGSAGAALMASVGVRSPTIFIVAGLAALVGAHAFLARATAYRHEGSPPADSL